MGLFKRKHSEETADSEAYRWMTVDEALAYSRGSSRVSEDNMVKMVAELCTQIKQFQSQLEDTKTEYKSVTEYLADMQVIDNLSDRERAEITDAARMIVNLDDERQRFQNSDERLPADQHRILSENEDAMPDIIADLSQKEEYLKLVESDMRQIEGEKGVIKFDKDHAGERREFLKKLSYGVLLGVVVIFIALLLLANYTKHDYSIPFFITGVLALVFVVYYLFEVSRCSTNMKRGEAKMNRATVLMNKTKIKYVNTVNTLEYAYEKYHVRDCYELNKIWTQYVRMKDEEKRYRKNTQLLNAYQNNLSSSLGRAGVKKIDSWVHQPEVFISHGEMMDYHDAVDRRRRKLRAQIDFNIRQQENSAREIQNLKEKYAEYSDIIDSTIRRMGMAQGI